MKKSLLALFLAVVLTAPVFAAEKNMWVGGSFGYESASYSSFSGDNVDYDLLTIAPEFGWTIVDKWDIGLDLSYTTGKGSVYKEGGEIMDISSNPNDYTKIGIAPFIRYYLAKVADVDVILKGSIFYNKINYKNDGAPSPYDDLKYTQYGISIVPVISYSINETWSIGAALNFLELSYSHMSNDDDDDFKTDEFGFNVNNGSLISIGFAYHF